jgi:RNA polymerase sigma-70 factor (ECF subfamily)
MSERAAEDLMLIQRAQRGDKSALNELVRKYEQRAYQFAFRLTRSPEEASDIVAEAFVRVYNALPNFKGNSQFSTWLYRILTNCFLDIRKKESRRQTSSLESAMTTEDGELERQVEDETQDPHADVVSNERMRRVHNALQKLPDYQRQMIVMYHAEQKSYEDIAAALDLPIGTVKSRLNRARLSLREILSPDEELFRIG